ncbi:PGG domain containing protein [Trema orientale]|uniref:PGG domain containing protein n=1 Tax=Trema orientale TaxID=63057 RepID=A0A2P5C3F7_TREOI|nr:PGG domain containing protein [Trema orientale]
MQRELQWFKAVEKLIHPSLVNLRDENRRTARELFMTEHKELAAAGEKWMKDTSNSRMIFSTLIATFMFAAAFTVPGGNDSEGIPIFLWTKPFLVFAISDALALFLL